MNIKRLLGQSFTGQQIRKCLHRMKAKKTYEGAISFLSSWPGLEGEIVPDMAKDMYEFCKKYNYSYVEYMFYHFFSRNISDRLEFISSEERIYCCEKLNKARNWDVFENKANTYMIYKNYYKRDVCTIRRPKDPSEKNKLKKFIQNNHCFMAKTLDDAGGIGVTKFEVFPEQLTDNWISEFLTRYPNGCMCEQLISQSEEFRKFHPESVNTLRITTIRFDDHIEIIHPAMKVGTGHNFVDNAGCNGILCAMKLQQKNYCHCR
jgi:hypothetical protein